MTNILIYDSLCGSSFVCMFQIRKRASTVLQSMETEEAKNGAYCKNAPQNLDEPLRYMTIRKVYIMATRKSSFIFN